MARMALLRHPYLDQCSLSEKTWFKSCGQAKIYCCEPNAKFRLITQSFRPLLSVTTRNSLACGKRAYSWHAVRGQCWAWHLAQLRPDATQRRSINRYHPWLAVSVGLKLP